MLFIQDSDHTINAEVKLCCFSELPFSFTLPTPAGVERSGPLLCQVSPAMRPSRFDAIEFRKKKGTLSRARKARFDAIFWGSDRSILYANFNIYLTRNYTSAELTNL